MFAVGEIMLQAELEKLLSSWVDPYSGLDLIKSKSLKHIEMVRDNLTLQVTLGYPLGEDGRVNYVNALKNHLKQDIRIEITTKIEPRINGAKVPQLKNIKNIIAVGSGKGGVGKSTVSFHLAQSLAKLGSRVGVLDADIYGPSQPSMFGLQDSKPEIVDGKFIPVSKGGIQTMSIGYLIPEEVPMIWRGPMLGKALQQILVDTKWNDLDYLIVDLPPGTGDIQLTLCQKMPLTGGILVTTPQKLSLLDVRRAGEMLKKMNIPILGIVENMSGYTCESCGHEAHVFDEGGGEVLAKLFETSLLNRIPLDTGIRHFTDNGHFFSDNKFNYETLFAELSRKVTGKIAAFPKDYSALFPNIKIEG